MRKFLYPLQGICHITYIIEANVKSKQVWEYFDDMDECWLSDFIVAET